MNMKTALRLTGALTLACMSAACATVTRGDKTAWEVQTTPSGAEVKTSNGMGCVSTPCSIRMPRKSQFVATITKSGYKETTVSVTNKVGTGGGVGMAGNVLFGGIIGAGVDVATGAMLDLTPNPAVVTLERVEVVAPAVAPPQPPAPSVVSAAPVGDEDAGESLDPEASKG